MYVPVEQSHSRAIFLVNRWERGEGTRYIDEAIVLAREALELCTPSHPGRDFSLNSPAIDLSNRYKQHGAIENLEEAIVPDREALDLCPPGHADRCTGEVRRGLGWLADSS